MLRQVNTLHSQYTSVYAKPYNVCLIEFDDCLQHVVELFIPSVCSVSVCMWINKLMSRTLSAAHVVRQQIPQI